MEYVQIKSSLRIILDEIDRRCLDCFLSHVSLVGYNCTLSIVHNLSQLKDVLPWNSRIFWQWVLLLLKYGTWVGVQFRGTSWGGVQTNACCSGNCELLTTLFQLASEPCHMIFQSSEFQNLKKIEAIGVNNMICVCQVSPLVSYIIYTVYIYIHTYPPRFNYDTHFWGGYHHPHPHPHTESTRGNSSTCPGWATEEVTQSSSTFGPTNPFVTWRRQNKRGSLVFVETKKNKGRRENGEIYIGFL